MSDDSPSVYVRDDGVTVYRASDIGGCVTRLAAARQGREKVEPRSYQQSIFDRGSDLEEWFFTEERPDLAHYRQMEVVLHVTKKILVVGHLDAFVSGVIEVKRQSDKEWKKWTEDSWTQDPLWIKYSWQVSSCMLGMGHPVGLVVRINGDTDPPEIAYEEITEPFWTQEQILERVLEVEALAHDDKLVCRTPDFFCGYPYLHEDDREVLEDDVLERMIDKYQHAKTLQTGAGVMLEESKEEIKKYLDTLGKSKVLLMSGRSVSKSEFDTKDHVVKGSHQVRLTVK